LKDTYLLQALRRSSRLPHRTWISKRELKDTYLPLRGGGLREMWISKRELKVSNLGFGRASRRHLVESQKENWKTILLAIIEPSRANGNLKKRIESVAGLHPRRRRRRNANLKKRIERWKVDLPHPLLLQESQKENWKSSNPPFALHLCTALFISESQKENWKSSNPETSTWVEMIFRNLKKRIES